MKKILNIQTLIIIIILLIPSLSHAQVTDPGNDPDASAPVDGGLSLLIAGGVGYGVKKMREKRREMK
ncbi:MAG: hypothetical protein J0I09_05060 [Sphingobacteriia bacterium]|nr:hypothetical protein [Sphingobacteriia bacterium]